MKPYILLFLAVLLVNCGGKTNKNTEKEPPVENTTEKVSRIPERFYGMEPSNALAKVVSEIDAIQGALVIIDMNGRTVSLAGQPPKQKNDDYDFWHLVAVTLNDYDYEMCKNFSDNTAIGQFLLEHYNMFTYLGPHRVVYTEPTYYEDMTIYYPARNPVCRIYVLIERKTSDVDDNYEHYGETIIKYLFDSLEQAPSEPMDKDDSCIVYREHDSVRFSYIEPVENYYRVTGVVSEYLNESDFAFVELTFHNFKTHKDFTIYGGSVYWKHFLDVDSIPTAPVRLNYPNILAEGVISAPDNTPFFFADLDFDGEKELITGNYVNAGTQRDVGRYTDIYKIIDGEPHEVTQEFLAKSKIFDEMDEYFFMVNPDRKELIFYESDGAFASGWQVHKFIDGDYIYDRHVEYVVRELKTMNYDITVTTPQGDTIRTFTVDKATFNCEKWEY